MPRVSFKGDQDSHLAELILASQTKTIDDAVLKHKERALVPFFDSPVDSAALQPLQGKAGLKKAPAPEKSRKAASTGAQPMAVDSAGGAKQTRRKKGAKAAPAEGAAAPAQPNNRKHHRDPSYRSLPSLAPGVSAGGGPAVSGRASPPRKRQESQFYDTASSAPHPMASRFAGPAFTNSPMPDALPIPTTSLLLNGLML